MQTINYANIDGYGTVHAPTISIHVSGYYFDKPINPIILIGSTGTFHFGTNRVLFQMD